MLIIRPDGRITPSFRLDEDIERLERLLVDLRAIRDGWRVDDARLDGAPTIDGWAIVMRDAPALLGNVTGHPVPGVGRGDRGLTLTSDLWVVDEGRRAARTLSRWYALGAPVAPPTMGDY